MDILEGHRIEDIRIVYRNIKSNLWKLASKLRSSYNIKSLNYEKIKRINIRRGDRYSVVYWRIRYKEVLFIENIGLYRVRNWNWYR